MARFGLMIGPLTESRTTRRLATLVHRLMPAGHELVELMYGDLPHHSPYSDVPAPSDGLAWRRSVAELDALIVITSSHTRSIPGTLKNALDWAGADGSSRELDGKPVAIAGAAIDEPGAFASLTHLRTVLSDAGARLMGQPEHMFTVLDGSLDDDGTCTDPVLFGAAEEFLAGAVGHAVHQLRASGSLPVVSAPESPAVGIPLAAAPAAAPEPA
ncbi:NADPH-dependent FMN reductase [Demequina sp. NBRC 110052]|uniref:NADPH-dependent FMN reductase n=1 Tax=Demequina sp. NBRC 110052 TaxID=1570341 RepID=UPI0013564972|nr:NADPH-dependent FMN reductase [Demequina sp. NBRC 110052]